MKSFWSHFPASLRNTRVNSPKTLQDLLNLQFKEPITQTDSWVPWQRLLWECEMCVEKDGSVSKWDLFRRLICQLPDRWWVRFYTLRIEIHVTWLKIISHVKWKGKGKMGIGHKTNKRVKVSSWTVINCHVSKPDCGASMPTLQLHLIW